MAHDIQNKPFLDIVDIVEQDPSLFPFFKHVFIRDIINNPNCFADLPPFIQEDEDIAKAAYQQLFIRSKRKDTNLELMDYSLKCLYNAKYKKEIDGRIRSIRDKELHDIAKEIDLDPMRIEFLCAENMRSDNFTKTVYAILRREDDIAKSTVCYKNILPVDDLKKLVKECEDEYHMIHPPKLHYIPPYKQQEIEAEEKRQLAQDYDDTMDAIYDSKNDYKIPEYILKDVKNFGDDA